MKAKTKNMLNQLGWCMIFFGIVATITLVVGNIVINIILDKTYENFAIMICNESGFELIDYKVTDGEFEYIRCGISMGNINNEIISDGVNNG